MELVGYLLIVFIAIDLIVAHYFYRVAFRRSRKKFLKTNKDLADVFTTPFIDHRPWLSTKEQHSFVITSKDGLKLSALLVKSSTNTKKLVILVHGYSSKGMDMLGITNYYVEKLNSDVLLPDLRAHGKSEGNTIGFGFPDKLDILDWVKRMISEYGEDVEITLHGISMGAATVLMSAGETLPANVKRVISDCSYSNVKDQLSLQMKRMYHLPAFPILNSVDLLLRIYNGYGLKDIDVAKSVASITIPVLFIHGTSDTFVPYRMMSDLSSACVSDHRCFTVEGAGHGMCYHTEQLGYQQVLADFMADKGC